MGKLKETFGQFFKFAVVGVMNTLIDLGVLNGLILLTGMAVGWQFSVFKGISFIAAVINSYFFNKFWTFKSKKSVGAGELLQFFAVSVGGFVVNVGTASLVVNVIGPLWGISPTLWANVGAISAIAFSMAWNFIGYKFLVFRR